MSNQARAQAKTTALEALVKLLDSEEEDIRLAAAQAILVHGHN